MVPLVCCSWLRLQLYHTLGLLKLLKETAVLYLGFVEAAKDDLIERIENLFEETSLDILKL